MGPEAACYPGVTPECEKWSGRPDSNRRPCAQGRLGIGFEVLISEQFATVENSWAHFWDHLIGDASLLTASDGNESQNSIVMEPLTRDRIIEVQ